MLYLKKRKFLYFLKLSQIQYPFIGLNYQVGYKSPKALTQNTFVILHKPKGFKTKHFCNIT